MKRTAMFVAALTLCSGLAIAQTEKPKPAAPTPVTKPAEAPKGQPSEAEMMEAFMKAAQPGKHHEHLMKSAGTWDGVVKHWHSPNMPPAESKCVTTMSSIMGGRYIKAETEGDMPGMGPFSGFGLYGYDNVSEKFVSVWIDNMGTGIMNGTGVQSADGKTVTWTMSMNDPITKKPMTMREVDKQIDDDHSVLEMFGPGPDGKETKMMEITYTRRAGTAKPAAKPAPATK